MISLVCSSGKSLAMRAKGLEKQAVGQLEDVGLVDAVDHLASMVAGPFEGEAEEALAGRFGDHLDALHHAGDDLVLDGGVEVFGQLADDKHVHVLKARRQAAQVLERPHRGKEPKGSAKLDVVVEALWPGWRQQLGLEGQAAVSNGLY